MNRNFYILLLLFCSLFLGAQEEQSNRTLLVGGSLNFATQDNGYPLSSNRLIPFGVGIYTGAAQNVQSTTFGISPYVGKQINERWILGLSMAYSYSKVNGENRIFQTIPEPGSPVTTVTSEYRRQGNDLGFGVFARYLINPVNQLKIYLAPNLSYNNSSTDYYDDGILDQEDRINYLFAGLGLGAMYDLNDRFRVLISTSGLSYVNGSVDYMGNTNESRDFSGVNVNLRTSSVSFGFEIKL